MGNKWLFSAKSVETIMYSSQKWWEGRYFFASWFFQIG